MCAMEQLSINRISTNLFHSLAGVCSEDNVIKCLDPSNVSTLPVCITSKVVFLPVWTGFMFNIIQMEEI